MVQEKGKIVHTSRDKSVPSANWGQIIAINLFNPPIIGIAIIGLQKVLLLLAIIGLHPKH